MAHRLRSWFLRNVLDSVERQYGSAALLQVRARLPERLHPHVSLDRLRASAVLDAIPLDDGEEVLLAIESALGDGAGKALESIGLELASRALGQAGSVVKRGDLYGTVARLQAFLEHPFVDVAVSFDLARTDGGFRLTCGVAGRSRSTKILRYLATGAIQAAERFARETTTGELTVFGENIADRGSVTARYRASARDSVPVEEEESPTSKRRSSVRPPAGPNSSAPHSLSQQVEQILGGAGVTGERRTSLTLRKPSDPTIPPQASGPRQSPSGSLRRASSDGSEPPRADASMPPNTRRSEK